MTGLHDEPSVVEMVEALRGLEERLRDLAYDRLRAAVEAGETKASPEQRRLEQARRAVARAIHALAPAGSQAEG